MYGVLYIEDISVANWRMNKIILESFDLRIYEELLYWSMELYYAIKVLYLNS